MNTSDNPNSFKQYAESYLTLFNSRYTEHVLSSQSAGKFTGTDHHIPEYNA
jgi:hypothetical protein